MLYLALRVRAGYSIFIPIYIYCYVQSIRINMYIIYNHTYIKTKVQTLYGVRFNCSTADS